MAQQPLLPGAYQSQLDDLALRQQLAQAMYKGAQQPQGQMVGQFYVKPSWTQNLASAFEKVLGMKGMADSSRERSKILGDYQTASQADRQKVIDMTREGPPETRNSYSMEGMTGGLDQQDYTRETSVVPGKQPDFLGAEKAAQASAFPETRALAETLAKERMARLNLAGSHSTPESVVAAARSGDPRNLQPLKGAEPTFITQPDGSRYIRSVDPKTGKIALQPAGPEEPKVQRVSLGKGLWQDFAFNPQTGKFDAKVGEPYSSLPSAARITAMGGAGGRAEAKAADSTGAQVGPMLKESKLDAEAALRTMDSASRVVKAVQSGKIVAQPGASWILKGLQVAQVLGISGKDEQDTILRTRAVIQGLADMAIGARRQLVAQGAISNSEQEAITRANSGSIDDLTAGEIALIAQAADRGARLQYAAHQQMLRNARAQPATAPLEPFFQSSRPEPEALPEAPPPNPPPPQRPRITTRQWGQ